MVYNNQSKDETLFCQTLKCKNQNKSRWKSRS